MKTVATTLMTAVVLTGSMTSYICADELMPAPKSAMVNPTQSKLEQIQANISEYQKYIKDLPQQMQLKEEQFNRLQRAGDRVEKVLRYYLDSVDSCSKDGLTPKGEEICQDMANLQLGGIIRKNKEHITGLIAVAEKELKAIQIDIKETLPLTRKALASLESVKELIMQGGSL